MCRKIIYYSIISVLSLLSLYFLYLTIGYCVLGSQAPSLIGNITAHFMGMYLMAITFGCALLITLTALIILLVLRKKILKIVAKSNDNIQIV